MIALLSLIVSFSVIWVWLFKSKSVQKDFHRFELETVTMIWVGLFKLATSVLLIIGLWSNPILLTSSLVMALFMIAAQYYHFKFNSSLIKRLPSLVLLSFSLTIAYLSL